MLKKKLYSSSLIKHQENGCNLMGGFLIHEKIRKDLKNKIFWNARVLLN